MQWFTEIPHGKLLVTAVSMRQGVATGYLGIRTQSAQDGYQAEIPDTCVHLLALPNKTLPNRPSSLMVNFWAFLDSC